MRFMCCLNMGFNFKILKMSTEMIALDTESIVAQTEHFADFNVAHSYDVVTTLIRSNFREKCDFGWSKN